MILGGVSVFLYFCVIFLIMLNNDMSSVDVEALMAKVKVLEAENARLRELCVRHGLSLVGERNIGVVGSGSGQLSLEQKVALFRDVFKGREDVFARRWYSLATQKSGYQPVCRREWNREFCRKPSQKCSECGNRLYAEIGYADLYNHLAGRDEYGRDVIGLYPMLTGNTCWFLCADFDDKSCEHGYRSDVAAFVEVCRRWNIPCYVERSRSGNGAHVWIFFSSPIAAAKARRLGCAVLTEAMSRNAMLSFKSYDRFFPNQDALGEGCLGNWWLCRFRARRGGMVTVFSLMIILRHTPINGRCWQTLCVLTSLPLMIFCSAFKLHRLGNW